ncbi:MAG: cupin domain-containing protein [Acidobacteriota bacterium]|nr:cupin domain-containing protein [Acidobacteriota bacterium]
MVVKLDVGCLVVALKEGEPIRDGALRIWKHFGHEAGARAISLRVLELPAGESASLRNDASDEVLYVIAGVGTGTIDGCDYELVPDSGIYLPPSIALNISADDTLTLVSSQCPDAGVTLEGYEPGRGAAGMPLVVAMRDRPIQRTGDRWYREVINADAGSTQVTQFVGSIPPGRAPDHFHQYEEVICILDGTGVMWAGQSHTPIARGSCIFLPRGQVHCLENRGEGELRLLGVFYPAGSPAVRYAAT